MNDQAPPMQPTTTPVISRARAALLILEQAERLALPLPFDVTVTDHTERISLMFHSVADLAQWALWLEVPIWEETHTDEWVHHVALGDALDQPVRLVRVQRPAVTA